jgi:hypothetical protein
MQRYCDFFFTVFLYQCLTVLLTGPLYPEGGLLAQRRVHAGDAIRYRQSDFLRGGYTGNIQEIKKKKNVSATPFTFI